MTTMLTTYEDFVARVESLGFMALSPLLPGLPSLGGETPESLWHTGLDTDPWRWKDRAAEEKRLAYGCILGGHKGFVTQRMYPIFYAGFHPMPSMPERWANGLINGRTWQLWQLFEKEGKRHDGIAYNHNPELRRIISDRPPDKGVALHHIAAVPCHKIFNAIGIAYYEAGEDDGFCQVFQDARGN